MNAENPILVKTQLLNTGHDVPPSQVFLDFERRLKTQLSGTLGTHHFCVLRLD